MARIAVIDIGTITARLAVSEKEQGSALSQLKKISTICNMGEGTAETGRLSSAAIERVLACVSGYVDEARAMGASACACTLTSAARDAENSSELLEPLAKLGLVPSVIPGTTEGSLALLGVVQDFPDEEVLVADSGGGSTELSQGKLADGRLHVDHVRSVNVGARRLTDLFLKKQDPPAAADIEAARAFCDGPFEEAVAELDELPEAATRLVLVGGTATSLVAMDAELDPYDSAYVHLHELERTTAERLAARLASLTVEERAHMKGLQAKRAPVILGGTLAISEVMKCTGFDVATVSEHDLLSGLSLATAAAWLGEEAPLPWTPALSTL